jgi:carbamoyl-phosphate synthase large subunit
MNFNQNAMALRRATLCNKVPYFTKMSTAQAYLIVVRSIKTKVITVSALQDI